MKTDMIHWIVFSTVAIGLFWGLYRLTLSRDRWLQLSRAYIILTMTFGLIYPLVHVPGASLPAEIRTTIALDGITVAPESESGALSTGTSASASKNLGMMDIIPMVYWGGAAVALLILTVTLGRTALRVRKMPFERREGAKLTLLDDDTEPLSFFKHIIIGKQAMSEEELRLVLAHESEHVRQRHTADVLLMRLMCCVTWFNPFAWMMLRELRAVHEYQADAATLGDGRMTIRPYMGLLFRQTTGFGYGYITHNFQSINLKKRITMMKQTKSRFGAWKALAVLPLAAILLMVGCKSSTDPETNGTGKQQQEVVANTDDPIYDVTESPVDVNPEYPGGQEALVKYLSENISYPEQAKQENIQGRVAISFVVEKDGSVADAKVLRGIGGGCDEEALRVVNAMPKWEPGKQNGENVRVRFVLPISFKLQ